MTASKEIKQLFNSDEYTVERPLHLFKQKAEV